MTETGTLTEWISNFIQGKDCSIANAQAIEVALEELFPGHAFIQDSVHMLACYRPGGGEYLYDEEQIKSQLQQIVGIVDSA